MVWIWLALAILAVAALCFGAWLYAKRKLITKAEAYIVNNENFKKLGLISYLKDNKIYHGGYAPKNISFYHKDFLIKTKYSFANYNYTQLQDTYMALDNLMNVNHFEDAFKILKTIESRAIKFASKHNLEMIKLDRLVPYLLIFGMNANYVRRAHEADAEPAVLAAILKGCNLDYEEAIVKVKELQGMPIEWLSNIYEFEVFDKDEGKF